jgi:hypothetical protein
MRRDADGCKDVGESGPAKPSVHFSGGVYCAELRFRSHGERSKFRRQAKRARPPTMLCGCERKRISPPRHSHRPRSNLEMAHVNDRSAADTAGHSVRLPRRLQRCADFHLSLWLTAFVEGFLRSTDNSVWMARQCSASSYQARRQDRHRHRRTSRDRLVRCHISQPFSGDPGRSARLRSLFYDFE